jgi:hypothetical protein
MAVTNHADSDLSGCMISVSLGSSGGLWAFPIFYGFGLACGLTGIMAAAQFGAPPDAM